MTDHGFRCEFSRRVIPPLVSLCLLGLLSISDARASALFWLTADAGEKAAEAKAACADLPRVRRGRCVRDADAIERAAEQRLAEANAMLQTYHLQLAQVVATDGSARGLALAAVLRTDGLDRSLESPADTQVLAWRDAAIARGAQSGIDDPLVLWLAYTVSGDEPALRRSLLQRWMSVEPDNLLPRMVALEPERGAQIGPEGYPLPQAFFDGLPAAGRFDQHYADMLRLVLAAVRRSPPGETLMQALQQLNVGIYGNGVTDADDYALEMGSMLWASGPAGQYRPLVLGCDAKRMASFADRRKDCRLLGRILHDRSDTIIGQIFGTLLLRLAAADAAEREAAGRLRRRLDWLLDRSRAIADHPSTRSEGTLPLLLGKEPLTEVKLLEAGLRAAGVQVEPPSCWTSRYRFPDEREAEQQAEPGRADAAD